MSSHGTKTQLRVLLPIQELTGTTGTSEVSLTDAGELSRVSLDLIGCLIDANTSIGSLDISRTSLGRVVMAEGSAEFIFKSLVPSGGGTSLHTLFMNDVALGEQVQRLASPGWRS